MEAEGGPSPQRRRRSPAQIAALLAVVEQSGLGNELLGSDPLPSPTGSVVLRWINFAPPIDGQIYVAALTVRSGLSNLAWV